MMTRMLPIVLTSLALAGVPLHAGPGNPQDQARKELRAGNIRPIRDIENRVIPGMAGSQYLGFEYDPAMLAYRLKFIRQGHVIFVDVDARSGEVIRQSR